jgi:transcriptional regulator with XRE-family HTH domain
LGVLIGLDEGCASARISRYETGIHEPPFSVAEKMAKILEIPVAYLYCVEEDLASLITALGDVAHSSRGVVIGEIFDVLGRHIERKG